MSRINRVTTKSGDRGKTSLAPGLRVDKSDFSIGALGSVDELSAFLGLLRTELIQKEEETEIEQIQQSNSKCTYMDFLTAPQSDITNAWSRNLSLNHLQL